MVSPLLCFFSLETSSPTTFYWTSMVSASCFVVVHKHKSGVRNRTPKLTMGCLPFSQPLLLSALGSVGNRTVPLRSAAFCSVSVLCSVRRGCPELGAQPAPPLADVPCLQQLLAGITHCAACDQAPSRPCFKTWAGYIIGVAITFSSVFS